MTATTSFVIAPADPRDPGPRALIEASHALMAALYAEGDNHALPADALADPPTRFFAAQDATGVLGTGALVPAEGYGEVKAMFTAPGARGRGIARAILARLEAEARALGLACLRLETGPELVAAVALYRSVGFTPCGAFGAYQPNGASLFMQKPLERDA
jgi:putative acetyltransferase